MTAADLFEIVKDVPRQAWPEGAYFGLAFGKPDFVAWEDGAKPSDRVAELAFIGSMTAWLAGGLWINRRMHTDGEMIYKVKASDGGCSVYGEHRTLVAALAAACKEAA